MKKSHYMLWTMTLLFAFVIVHVSAIFYIANKTESELNATQASRSTGKTNITFANLNHTAFSQPLAIN